MNEEWTRKSLGEVCEILDSRRKPITKRNRVAGPYPYYGATGVLDYVDGYIFDELLVLIGEDGAKWGAGDNTAYAVEGKCWVNNHAHVIRPNRNVMLDSWVIYYLNTTDLAPFISGLTVPKLNQGRLREIPIPIPPLPEQERIVAILNEAFTGIDTVVANTEKNLANARELFDEFVVSSLKDNSREWTTLGELSERMEYGSSSKSAGDGLVPVLRMGNIARGRFSWSDLKYSSNPSEIEKYKLDCNDVLFNRTNSPELVGKTAIYKGEKEAIFAGYLIRIHRNKALLDPDFLCYFLNSSLAMNYGRSVMSSSVNQANINATKLKSYPMPALSIDEQQSLVEIFEEFSSETQRLEVIYQQKLTALAELKQSLLQKAFSGELTANVAEASVEEATA